ncbi:Multiple sugar-binding protein [Defluviimonas aquaemixtae]|uniref:Multiple sugar-binding protein n=1 Tax=Albidovulum aquaemixtae TaxID=1542388 RepID=A0A2R8B8A0_9RHOB|nr:extracellular solute-binding protein [Defluviimonas aquaemixtae]SPH18826.1 Multiple sugar-binding protein [Defluviimonas aquaemixtae]
MIARSLDSLLVKVAVMLWLAVVATTAAMAEGRVALVVGNSDYEYVSALPNPRNDAAAIQTKLLELGFTVVSSLNADLEGIRANLDRFKQEAAGADIALIFYAGHGLQISGENYILPIDARITTPSDLQSAAIRTSELYETFRSAQPKLAILILDACRNNPLTDVLGTAPGLTSGTASPREFVRNPESAGMIIAFAAAPGAVAYDGIDGNSPYTTALLQWIDRPGLELGTMFRKVRGTVLDLTQGAQIPWVEEALLREVYLNPLDPNALAGIVESARVELALLETIRALDDPVEQAAGAEFYDRYVDGDQVLEEATIQRASLTDDTELSQDEAFAQQGLIWLSIRRSDDPDVFRAFVTRFPGSPFEALALARIEALEAADPPPVLAELATGNFGASAGDGATEAAGVSGFGTEDTARPETVAELGGTPEGADQPLLPLATPDSPSVVEAQFGFGKPHLAAVQLLLRQAGSYGGPIDGDVGQQSRRAITDFQSAQELPASGYLDLETLLALVRQNARPVLLGDLPDEMRDALHRVAATAARGPGAAPETIRVIAISRNDDVHNYWREVADEFEAGHPGYRIALSFQPGQEYQRRLMAILGSEDPPDILYTWGGGHLDALRQAGFARDLTAEMTDGWALEFRPGALQNYTFDGQIYGAPALMSLISLWVNRKVMAEAGLPVEALATWEGFLDTVAELKRRGVTPIAIGGGDEWPFELYWANLAQQIGGRSAFQDAYQGLGQGFRDPVFVEAGRQFRRLADLEPFQQGHLAMDDGLAVEAFAQGEAAMVLTGNWRLQKMRWKWPGGPERMQAELLRLPFPRVDQAADIGITYGGVDGFAVNMNAPDAAVEFLKLMTSPQVQLRMIELASSLPSVSGTDISIEDPFLSGVAKELLESSHHQLYYDQALGPVAGETLTQLAMAIGQRAMTGPEAAERLDEVWDRVLIENRGTEPSQTIPAE